MTVEIGLVFVIVALALYLFATEKFPLDITAFLILITVTSIPLLFHSQWLIDRGVDLQGAFPTVSEGLSGLSSPATITVLAMFILSAGIQRSGLIHVLGQRLTPWMAGPEWRRLTIIALLVGPISGLINNTAAVAVGIPLILSLARNSNSPAARMLLPLSFFAMLGGTLTLIGTSTNLLASTLLADTPGFARELGMFEFSGVGLIVLISGWLYFLLIGRWLMPKRDRIRIDHADAELFIFEARVIEESRLIDRSVDDAGFCDNTGLEVLRLIRGGTSHIKRARTLSLKADDVLRLRGNLRQIADLIKSGELELLSASGTSNRVRSDGQLTRVLLRNERIFRRNSKHQVDFWHRYRARLVGLETDELSNQHLVNETLGVGQIVLVQISATSLARLRRNPDVVVLDSFEDEFNKTRMWSAGLILAGVVLGAVLTPLPIVITALIGVVAMILSGCLAREDLYSGVAWNIIFLLAGVIPLGIAMTKSGAADWIASLVASGAADWHPLVVLMVLYLITTSLTEIVSSNAAVVILVPVAIAIAGLLELAILPLVLVVMFAASTSFLSPISYQTNTMIYGTGLYRFSDFSKVGALLNLILLFATCLAIYAFFPVYPA